MNAYVINKYGFGISEADLTEFGLNRFIKNIKTYARNIQQDSKILLKADNNAVIEQIVL